MENEKEIKQKSTAGQHGFDLNAVNAAMKKDPKLIDKNIGDLMKRNCVFDENNVPITDRRVFDSKSAVVIRQPGQQTNETYPAVIIKTPGKKDYAVMFARDLHENSCLSCAKLMNAPAAENKLKDAKFPLYQEMADAYHYGISGFTGPGNLSCANLITKKLVDLGCIIDPLGKPVQNFNDMKPDTPYLCQVLNENNQQFRMAFTVDKKGAVKNLSKDYSELLSDKNAYAKVLNDYVNKTTPARKYESAEVAELEKAPYRIYHKWLSTVYNPVSNDIQFFGNVKDFEKTAESRAWERERLATAVSYIAVSNNGFPFSKDDVRAWSDETLDAFTAKPAVKEFLDKCRVDEILRPSQTAATLQNKDARAALENDFSGMVVQMDLDTLQNPTVTSRERGRAYQRLVTQGCIYEPKAEFQDVKPEDMDKPVDPAAFTHAIPSSGEGIPPQFCVKVTPDSPVILYTKAFGGAYQTKPVENRHISTQYVSEFQNLVTRAEDTKRTAAERKIDYKKLWGYGCIYNENGEMLQYKSGDQQSTLIRNTATMTMFHTPINGDQIKTNLDFNPFPLLNEQIKKDEQAREQAEREEAERQAAIAERARTLDSAMNNEIFDSDSFRDKLVDMISQRKLFEKVNGQYEFITDLDKMDSGKTFYVEPLGTREEKYAFRVDSKGFTKMFTLEEEAQAKEAAESVVNEANAMMDELEEHSVKANTDRLNKLIKNKCVYDGDNHLIKTMEDLSKAGRVQFHSLGDDTVTTGMVPNPYNALQAWADRKLNGYLAVLENKDVTEEERQKAFSDMVGDGFAVSARGTESGVVNDDSAIGKAFVITTPYNDRVSHVCHKTVTGEYRCMERTPELAQHCSYRNSKIAKYTSTIGLTDNTKEIRDLNSMLRNGDLYDENDLLITDKETCDTKNAIMFHTPDLNKNNVEKNGIIVRDPVSKNYFHYYEVYRNREEFYQPLSQIMNGAEDQVSPEKFHDVLDRVFTKDTYKIGLVDRLGTEEIRGAVLNQLALSGHVVDLMGRQITDPAMLPGKKFMIQNVSDKGIYREGFEMSKNGTVKCVAPNLANNRDAQFDFVKAATVKPKAPNIFAQAVDGIMRLFGSKGLESCIKYRAEKIFAERTPFASVQKSKFDPSASPLTYEKSTELVNWEREKIADILELGIEIDNERLDKTRESDSVQEVLEEEQWLLQQQYAVTNLLMSQDVEEVIPDAAVQEKFREAEEPQKLDEINEEGLAVEYPLENGIKNIIDVKKMTAKDRLEKSRETREKMGINGAKTEHVTFEQPDSKKAVNEKKNEMDSHHV